MIIPELPDFLSHLGGAEYKGLIISLFTLSAAISRPFSGKLADEIPSHGVLATVRQHIPVERGVGAVAPEKVNESPEWLNGKSAL